LVANTASSKSSQIKLEEICKMTLLCNLRHDIVTFLEDFICLISAYHSRIQQVLPPLRIITESDITQIYLKDNVCNPETQYVG